MDLLQVALILVILVVAVMLSVLGIQVFFILRDLRKSIEKIDQLLEGNPAPKEVQVAEEIKITETNGKAKNNSRAKTSSAKRFFKRL